MISLITTIEQYIKGNITFDVPEIIVSDTEIQVSVEAGKTYSGTIRITNDKQKSMKGAIGSNHPNIRVREEQFVGEETILHYTIDAKNQHPGDKVEGIITILSDCGERSISVTADITSKKLKVDEHELNNLTQFADLAKEDWATALNLFKLSQFEEVILEHEPDGYKELYRHLLKGGSPSGAMEEFLIAIHKKQPIRLHVLRESFHYDHIENVTRDKIVVTKDHWGYTEVKVSTDVDFIDLDHKIIWSDNFIGNQYSLEFELIPERLCPGTNQGYIYLETPMQTFAIEIVCKQTKEITEKMVQRLQHKKNRKSLLEHYLSLRSQTIGVQEYITKVDDILSRCATEEIDEHNALLAVHLLCMKGERLQAKQQLENYETRLSYWKEQQPVLYCAYFYLKAMIEQDEVSIQIASDFIRDIYDHGNHEFLILWFLIYLDKRYMNHRVLLLEDLKEQYVSGCHSPMLYYEVSSIYNIDPNYLTELDEFAIQSMVFAVKRGQVSEELAKRYAYLASKERYYQRLVFKTLAQLYDAYPSKEILTAICTTLIKGHQRSNRYFIWYKRGVEAQLRVTELQEYYMYTIDEASTEPLPQSILMYFIYNSRLNDKKRAYLYARIVKEKDKNPSIYRTYVKKMEQFALKQMSTSNISENLAVLYNDLLEQNQMDQTYYPYISELAFYRLIRCNHKQIKGLYVVHEETSEEEYVPLNGQTAMVKVRTDHVSYYFVDGRGQRYVSSVAYDEIRYFTQSKALQKIIDHSDGTIYPHVKRLAAERAYESYDEASVIMCKKAMELPDIKRKYREALLEQLVLYYAKHRRLDEMRECFEMLQWERMNETMKQAIVNACIEVGQYELVVEFLHLIQMELLIEEQRSQLCMYAIKANSSRIAKEEVLQLCYKVFCLGNREKEVISYIVQSYVGVMQEWMKLYHAAVESELDVSALEEQLLVQVLFTRGDVETYEDLFLCYYKHKSNETIVQAYLQYVCAKFLMQDKSPSIGILQCLKLEVEQQANLYYTLALLKYTSEYTSEWAGEDPTWLIPLLDIACNEGIVLPSFQALETKIPLPNMVRERTWIQYRAEDEGPKMLQYRIIDTEDEGTKEFSSICLSPCMLGLYVSSFVVFCNETLEYYITDVYGSEESKTDVMYATYESMGSNHPSRFEELNDMLQLYQEGNASEETLMKRLDQHVKKEFIIQQYFKTL